MAEISHPGAPGLSQANISEPQAEAGSAQESQPIYEVGFHLVPNLGEEGAGATMQKIRALLKDSEILSEQVPQKMTLAYVIERATAGKRERFTEAYFGWVKFAAPRSALPALEASLRAEPSILRYLVIETLREDVSTVSRRAVFTSARLEGEVIKKPAAAKEEKVGEVSEEELDKSLDALIS